LVKSFDVPLAYGAIDLSIPKVETDQAIFSAIRITDAKGQVIRRLFGTHDYHDVVNDRWLPVQLVGFDWNQLSGDILKRVHDDGTRLVIVSNDTDAGDIQEAALALAKQGVMTFQGLLGNSSAPWMGRWYFGKKHWLLNGLPAGCVLDWPYQITGGNGLLMDAPGLDTVLGYGINHSPTPAVGTAVIPYGKGQIVLFCIPGLGPSFKSGTNAGIDPVTADRIIYNSLAGSQLVTN